MYEKDRMTTTAWLLSLLEVPTMSPMTVTSEPRRGSRVVSHRGIVGNNANTEKETDFTGRAMCFPYCTGENSLQSITFIVSKVKMRGVNIAVKLLRFYFGKKTSLFHDKLKIPISKCPFFWEFFPSWNEKFDRAVDVVMVDCEDLSPAAWWALSLPPGHSQKA
ncbi:hypothetical protein V8E54_008888 [Elaphomyces granulatus]